MKGSIAAYSLCFAAVVILIAPATTLQAQGRGQSICRDVWDWSSGRYVQVCNDVYYPPPSPSPPPAPNPPARQTTSTESTIRYNAAAEERKAQLQAIERGGAPDRGTQSGTNLCPPPYRMTARDGCQPAR
jgi:hypothetical protein